MSTCPRCGLPLNNGKCANGACDFFDRYPRVSFICPRCGATSWNATDVREGYCGSCHAWTGQL